MTPKEKAEELVDKMKIGDGSILNWTTGEMEYRPRNQYYKDCALIAVDEIMKHNSFPTMDYWQEVKQEIEKL
jgi:hypothetical protein